MNMAKPQRSLFMSGIVYVDRWNKKGDVTDLSLISNGGKEYRIYSNHEAKRLSNNVWDEVEVEFFFIDGFNDDLWIEIIHFKPYSQSFNLLYNQVFDGIQHDFKNERNDWQFDIDTFIDRFEESEAA